MPQFPNHVEDHQAASLRPARMQQASEAIKAAAPVENMTDSALYEVAHSGAATKLRRVLQMVLAGDGLTTFDLGLTCNVYHDLPATTFKGATGETWIGITLGFEEEWYLSEPRLHIELNIGDRVFVSREHDFENCFEAIRSHFDQLWSAVDIGPLLRGEATLAELLQRELDGFDNLIEDVLHQSTFDFKPKKSEEEFDESDLLVLTITKGDEECHLTFE